MAIDTSSLIVANGIDATSGDYLVPPMDAEQASKIARGEQFDPTQLAELKWRNAQERAHFGLKQGVDPRDIAQAGWGVIFPSETDPAIKDALGELLEHRKAQANRLRPRYGEYAGAQGFRPTETKNSFLTRLGTGPGPVDPDVVPYYLLLVGDPDAIPFSFQTQLDVAYAVGRIHFDSVDEYARYAHSVVQAEQQHLRSPRTAAFFGVRNPDDSATHLSANHLVAPLADKMRQEHPDWSLRTVIGEDATKTRLGRLMGGDETSSLLFTASHGIGYSCNNEFQYQRQGALLCQDWPGPVAGRGRRISPDWYFAADDVSADACLFGMIVFHFACFGAGTPRFDEFAHVREGIRERTEIAPVSFVANLPKRLLSHPKGSALAVIGHIERAWASSFLWGAAGQQLTVFESMLGRLMEGYPIGSALEFFNERYAELSTMLSSELEEAKFGKQIEPYALSRLWTANNDARGYAVMGDPAVRLMI